MTSSVIRWRVLAALVVVSVHSMVAAADAGVPGSTAARARVAAAEPTPSAPDDRLLADAYVYLLGRVLVIRQEHVDRGTARNPPPCPCC
jgi:hypothetical protein